MALHSGKFTDEQEEELVRLAQEAAKNSIRAALIDLGVDKDQAQHVIDQSGEFSLAISQVTKAVLHEFSAAGRIRTSAG